MARGGKKSGKGPRRGRAPGGDGQGGISAAETDYWLRVFGAGRQEEAGDAGGTGARNPESAPAGGDDLWAQVTRGVKPLWVEERRRGKTPAAGEGALRKGRRKEGRGGAAGVPGPVPAVPLLEKLLRQGGAALPSAQHPGAGLDRRSDLKLKRGRMEIEGRLDLHGMNRARAYEELRRFVTTAQGRGWRCVLVITGKGRAGTEGVLKRDVPEWLAQAPLRDIVLRFYRAQPQDGGSGALYVLLRRER